MKHENPDLLLTLPVAAAPHKSAQQQISFYDRFEMCRLQFQPLLKSEAFRLSRLENHLPAPNYTLRTVQRLQQCFSKAQLSVVLGQDSFESLATWYQAEALVKLVDFIVLKRKDTEVLTSLDNVRWRALENPLWDTSSSLLRDWFTDYYTATDQQESYIQGWVAGLIQQQIAPEVFEYIVQRGLYR